MRTVHKFQLKVTSAPQTIDLPHSARALSVQMQNDVPTVWIETDFERATEILRVEISVVGTGHPIPPVAEYYLGTVQMGNHVWHFYHDSFRLWRNGMNT